MTITRRCPSYYYAWGNGIVGSGGDSDTSDRRVRAVQRIGNDDKNILSSSRTRGSRIGGEIGVEGSRRDSDSSDRRARGNGGL